MLKRAYLKGKSVYVHQVEPTKSDFVFNFIVFLSLNEPLLTSNDIDSKKIRSCKTNKRQLFRIISYFL